MRAGSGRRLSDGKIHHISRADGVHDMYEIVSLEVLVGRVSEQLSVTGKPK